MILDSALVGGVFALGGVALQQSFSMVVDKRRARHAHAYELQRERVRIYRQTIADARRVQRSLKRSCEPGVDRLAADQKVQSDIDGLAESVAAVRLLGSSESSAALESFETLAREVAGRPVVERGRTEEGLQLKPILAAFRDEMGIDALSNATRD